MRFKKILVALDFSEPSRIALQSAVAMAADTGAQLVLAHVWQPNAYSYGGPAFPVSFVEDYVREAQGQLDVWRREAETGGARNLTTQLLTGTPWNEIVELARKDESIDLIVVGTHGHTGIKHALLGSVAERIARHAPCPVLVTRSRNR